jgi:hypothetical protein
MRSGINDRSGARRPPGYEYLVTDAVGRDFMAKVIAYQPIAGGLVHYEVEVSPEAEEPLLFAQPADSEDPRLCAEKDVVGDRVRQCILDHGHFGPHQFQL